MKPSEWQQPGLALRREKALQTKWQPARGAGCARSSTASGGGRKISLDIPFYRTFPQPRRLRSTFSYGIRILGARPLRHPTRPGLSLASCQLILTANHRWGFPCCVWSPMPTCHRHYPGRLNGACSLVSLHPQRPSLCNSQVGFCNCCFGACSAFTHVMACTLAESPRDPLHRRLRQLRCLRCRFDCYRVERTSSRAGVSPAEVQRLFTAHYFANYPSNSSVSPQTGVLGVENNARVAALSVTHGEQ